MRPLVLLLLASLLAACTGTRTQEGPAPAPSGPPEIQYDVVRQHAQQFDVDLPSRPAGSQQELAAATYILGHLQLAGYSPALDAVPVSNQVQSSNVIALPPGGDDPALVVAVAYDTDGGRLRGGDRLGLLLEAARALVVADPHHRVGFAFLGAESIDEAGSMKLVRFMTVRGYRPQLIYWRGAEDPGLWMIGACALSYEGTEFREAIRDCDEGFFEDQGLEPGFRGQTVVQGDARRVGPELFGFLTTDPDY